MVLMAPVTSGRAYRRELTMMAKMGHKAAPREGEALSVGGIAKRAQAREHRGHMIDGSGGGFR